MTIEQRKQRIEKRRLNISRLKEKGKRTKHPLWNKMWLRVTVRMLLIANIFMWGFVLINCR